MFPTIRPTLSKFFKLSYFDTTTGEYGKGLEDWYLVGFWVIVFTLLRASAIEYLFFPFARKNGIRTHKALVRFAEQAWLLLYYTFFWTLGMVCATLVLG
jgi:very-long-chain ceramide synthase